MFELNMKTIGIIEFPYNTNRSYKLNQYKEWISPHVNTVFLDFTIQLDLISKELDQLDGIIWPGGNIEDDTYHTDHEFLTYMKYIDFTYSYAKERNKKKKFTIIGICLGFEILGLLCVSSKITLSYFDHLQITPKKGMSTLVLDDSIKIFTKEEKEIMKTSNVVMHVHAYGFNMKSNVTKELKKCANILSIDSFENGDFVNMFQYKKYPFYGMMFHPEKTNNFVSKKLAKYFSKIL